MIENRKPKKVSDKLYTQLMMYVILLNEGIYFVSELGLDYSKSSDRRKIQSYNKELKDLGICPDLKKIRGLYITEDEYDPFETADEQKKRANNPKQAAFISEVTRIRRPHFLFALCSNEYQKSMVNYLLGSKILTDTQLLNSSRLARLCALARRYFEYYYFENNMEEDLIYPNEIAHKKFDNVNELLDKLDDIQLKNTKFEIDEDIINELYDYYFKYTDKSKRTFERDLYLTLNVIANCKLDEDLIEKKYRKYFKDIRDTE